MNYKGLQHTVILCVMCVFLQNATSICPLGSLNKTQLSKPRGRFYSPNYPSTYNDSTTHTWSLTMATDVRIQLHIFIDELQESRLGEHTECVDYIEIQEQGIEDSVVRICGKRKIVSFLSSGGTNMSVQFSSDCSVGFKGFRAVYSVFKDICPKGWFYFNGSCYEVFKRRTTWLKAHEACRKINGHLLSISNADEQELISGMTSWNGVERYWIGLNDLEIEGEYHWSDGKPLDFTNWKNFEPNNNFGKEDCVEIASSIPKWNDNNCKNNYGFICKTSRAHTAVGARRWLVLMGLLCALTLLSFY